MGGVEVVFGYHLGIANEMDSGWYIMDTIRHFKAAHMLWVKYGHPNLGMKGTLGEGCRSPVGTIYV